MPSYKIVNNPFKINQEVQQVDAGIYNNFIENEISCHADTTNNNVTRHGFVSDLDDSKLVISSPLLTRYNNKENDLIYKTKDQLLLQIPNDTQHQRSSRSVASSSRMSSPDLFPHITQFNNNKNPADNNALRWNNLGSSMQLNQSQISFD